jgi:2-polyprenyl-3-methyl-5-hydroxy-6-metoxy-1,4-benzoquinol methylase
LIKVHDTPNENLFPAQFKPSDFNYGSSLSRFRCQECNFVFCPDAENIGHFYEEMEDSEYVSSDKTRLMQSNEILNAVSQFKTEGNFLDYGAGIGNLVEVATNKGFTAVGFEISKSFILEANSRGRNISNDVDVIKQDKFYDVITLIDVIEHVTNPRELLLDLKKALKADGILVVVTPNINSTIAKLMRGKWHHYRIAHVGYFDTCTLGLLAEQIKMLNIFKKYPNWYFEKEYIFNRIDNIGLRCLTYLFRWTTRHQEYFRLNLRDSILMIFANKNE